MGTVQMDLLRLHSATNAYLKILEDALMAVEVLAETNPPGVLNPAAALRDAVKTGLLDAKTVGTPANIADKLAMVLNEK